MYGVTLMVNLNSRRTRLWNRTATDDPITMPTSAFSIPGVEARQPAQQTVVNVAPHVEHTSDSPDDFRKVCLISYRVYSLLMIRLALKVHPHDDDDLEMHPTRKFSRTESIKFTHPMPAP